ncbi:hypothetical protein PRABACTJOHN_01102 [Parabacteroides johnsonii DSM 18315]|uniref:Minor fimbrium subunit Mfa1 C-terminal domain-containing protein n=2 Tax=Parabacteroides johnsonii TaxID=387661 RepID=B7B7V2_9BACT|nr:hypothetical protein PRABACTJOHN_01102 [Parabacteroides johnsonii DSM 18315]HJG99690.1 fimbria major subunit [Parabacteroides johnsonii]
MKMKSTLWALAFACAAVSCSDDFEDPNNGGNDSDLNGETAKMKVVIKTEVTTKASASAEEGDDDELGTKEESEVKDLTVFLFTDGNAATTDVIDFTGTSDIIATGYTTVDNTEGSDHPDKHGWQAEVKVKVTEKGTATTLAGNTYGVIAVTNIGSEALANEAGITTGAQLADYLQASIYTDSKGFVMSTHMLVDDAGHRSEVEFPAATSGDQEIPEVEVFVERLAAKVRINPAADVTGYLYEIVNSDDKVALQQAAVLNQLTSGSYLLKRATSKVAANLLEELDLTANPADVYLEDEAYNDTDGKANFVIDPWTRLKNGVTVFTDGNVAMPTTTTTALPAAANKQLAYGNYLTGTLTGGAMTSQNFNTYSAWYDALPTSTTAFASRQLTAKTLTGTDPLTLAYTMENTTNVANSLNGFSTGVLFKATYYADQTMQIDTDNKSVNPADSDWGRDDTDVDNLTFYTYRSHKDMKFASLEAIFAYTLAQQVEDVDKYSGNDYYFYNTFMTDAQDVSATFDALTVKAFKESKTYTENRVDDVFGYLAYLKTNLESAQDNATLGSLKEKDDQNANLKTFKEYITALADADKYVHVKSYIDGECYYLYWIRHENNDNYNKIGPMEFDIVRNNIYDLTVAGISGLGLSGIEVPDPKNPDEDGTTKMNVVVKVKNWVVRNNGGIIL